MSNHKQDLYNISEPELKAEFKELLSWLPIIWDFNIPISRETLSEIQGQIFLCNYLLDRTDGERKLLVRAAFCWRVRHDNRILTRPWEKPLPLAEIVREIEEGVSNSKSSYCDTSYIDTGTPEDKFDENTDNEYDRQFIENIKNIF